MKPVKLLAPAKTEIRAAMKWYESRQIGLGLEFVAVGRRLLFLLGRAGGSRGIRGRLRRLPLRDDRTGQGPLLRLDERREARDEGKIGIGIDALVNLGLGLLRGAGEALECGPHDLRPRVL